MTESYLEKLVPEKDYACLLEGRAQLFFQLANTLRRARDERWSKRLYFELWSEADALESFLDDYGARWNRTYNYFTELAASVRGFAMGGLSLEHLSRRIAGYRVLDSLPPREARSARDALESARAFVQSSLVTFIDGLRDEACALGLALPSACFPKEHFDEDVERFSLPRNVGQEEIADEAQRIAAVASKYLQVCAMLDELKIRPLASAEAREAWLLQHCTEEQARVYEASVHNLQSAYDTHVKNTVLEAEDERLPRLRGHVSSALHMLEAVTQLTHFVERHESGVRTAAAERRLQGLVSRADVQRVALDELLCWAHRLLSAGRELAEALLPAYTNVQTLKVSLGDGITVHARPAALIVAIVNHHGTPVEMELCSQRCNAGSILELMILVGSHPEERCFAFHGDQHPLRDIGLLFEGQLGERGIEMLPPELSYLRHR